MKFKSVIISAIKYPSIMIFASILSVFVYIIYMYYNIKYACCFQL